MSSIVDRKAPLIPASFAGRTVLARFFQAVSDPNRLALIEFLLDDEHTGTECVNLLGLAQGRVSSHLQCLVNCGLVSSRREGHFTYYKVEDSRVIELVRLGVAVATDHAEAVAACTRL